MPPGCGQQETPNVKPFRCTGSIESRGGPAGENPDSDHGSSLKVLVIYNSLEGDSTGEEIGDRPHASPRPSSSSGGFRLAGLGAAPISNRSS